MEHSLPVCSRSPSIASGRKQPPLWIARQAPIATKPTSTERCRPNTGRRRQDSTVELQPRQKAGHVDRVVVWLLLLSMSATIVLTE